MKKLFMIMGILILGVNFENIYTKRCNTSKSCHNGRAQIDSTYRNDFYCYPYPKSYAAKFTFTNGSKSRMTFNSFQGKLSLEPSHNRTFGKNKSDLYDDCNECDLEAEAKQITRMIHFIDKNDWFTVTAHHVYDEKRHDYKDISVDYNIKDFFAGADGGDADGSKNFTNENIFTITTEGATVNIHRPDGTKINPR